MLHAIILRSLNYLPEHEDPVLAANASSLDRDEIIVDFTIVREATHGCDRLLGEIIVSSPAVLDQLAIESPDGIADTIDLPVGFCPVTVALLTGTSNSELDPAGMPSTNTGNFTQTLVSLTGELLCVPTGGDA